MEISKSKSYVTFDTIDNIINYQLSSIQRLLNSEHVNYLVNDQIKEYDKYKQYSILQTITCADYNNKRYVLDGQHRIKAFKELKELNYPVNISIPIVVYNVNELNELYGYYERINKHHPINPLELEDKWMDVGKNFFNWFLAEYKLYIKNKNCNCPHINLQDLMLYFNKFKIHNKLENINDLINKIKELNTYLLNNYEKIVKSQIQSDYVKRLEVCVKKNMMKPCFLGIWRQYEWVELCLYSLENNLSFNDINLSHFCVSRPKIPKKTKNDVWNKRNKNNLEGKCFCCNEILHYDNMECGHIIPFCKGGDINIENLEPICKNCNRDMGIVNLFEYKKTIK